MQMDFSGLSRPESRQSRLSFKTDDDRRVYFPPFDQSVEAKDASIRPVSARTYEQLASIEYEDETLQKDSLPDFRLETSERTFAERRRSSLLKSARSWTLNNEIDPPSNEQKREIGSIQKTPSLPTDIVDVRFEPEQALTSTSFSKEITFNERFSFIDAPGSRQSTTPCFIIRDR